jgi:hypothetical protein
LRRLRQQSPRLAPLRLRAGLEKRRADAPVTPTYFEGTMQISNTTNTYDLSQLQKVLGGQDQPDADGDGQTSPTASASNGSAASPSPSAAPLESVTFFALINVQQQQGADASGVTSGANVVHHGHHGHGGHGFQGVGTDASGQANASTSTTPTDPTGTTETQVA